MTPLVVVSMRSPMRAIHVAWLALLLLMALMIGYQAACAYLVSTQLAAAVRAKDEAAVNLAQSAALLHDIKRQRAPGQVQL